MCDQGVGIEEAHLPHIFEDFYRAPAAGDYDSDGVGLGLAIVQRLAALSGFSIAWDSKRGVGTTVRLSGIPISKHPLQPAVGFATDASQPLAGLRVILIEDDLDVLEATEGLLNRWGCKVQTHATMPDTVTDADIIVSDFDLGAGIAGTEVIAAIRTRLTRSIPAVLITGHTDNILCRALTDEDITLLAKPVQPATLRSILSSIRVRRFDQS